MNTVIDLNFEEIEAVEELVSDKDAEGMRFAKAIRKMRGKAKSSLGYKRKRRVKVENITSALGNDLIEARKQENRLVHELTKEMCRN